MKWRNGYKVIIYNIKTKLYLIHDNILNIIYPRQLVRFLSLSFSHRTYCQRIKVHYSYQRYQVQWVAWYTGIILTDRNHDVVACQRRVQCWLEFVIFEIPATVTWQSPISKRYIALIIVSVSAMPRGSDLRRIDRNRGREQRSFNN